MAGACAAPPASNDDIQRLRSLLLSPSTSTALNISALCPPLQAQARHQPRAFFRICFPLLLRRLFGYDDLQILTPSAAPSASSPLQTGGGWLALVSQPGNEAAAQALVALLSPTGALFRSLLAADKENFVRYAFPSERLPDWVRRLLALSNGAGILAQISVLFKDKLKEVASGGVQVELDVFQYYMFWFAYYAICKDMGSLAGRRTRSSSSSRSAQLRTQIELWASSIPGLHHAAHHGSPSLHFHPYLQLLQLYLSYFVVDPFVTRANSGLQTGQIEALAPTHGSILVHTLVDFWLVDDDPLPIPLSVRNSLHIQLQAGGGLSFIPPGSDLTDSLKHLINYFSSVLQISTLRRKDVVGMVLAEDPSMGYRRKGVLTSGIGSSPGPATLSTSSSALSSPIAPYLQSLQRPLYRFLLRAFRFWPVGSPVKNVSQLVDVWIDFLEPWEFAEAVSAMQKVPKDGESKPTSDHSWNSSPLSSVPAAGENTCQYTGQWQGYVLSNYLFYTSLIGYFLEFTLKFVDMDLETIFQLIFKVLHVLAKSKELLETLRKVDAAYTDHVLGRHSASSTHLSDLVPRIREQLQDWEEGIVSNSEKELVGSSSTTKGYPSLRFFSSNENGACHLLQPLILHAEAEAQVSRGKSPVSEQTMKAIKEVAYEIFDIKMISNFPTSASRPAESSTSFADTGGPKAVTESLGLRRHSWAEVKYKGDLMRRPIESKEIAFLVRLLVKLSDTINQSLGLSPEDLRDVCQSQSTDLQASASSVVSQTTEIPVMQELQLCLPELLRGVHHLVRRCCLLLRQEMRRRGWRVNLRFIAEKQFVGLVCSLVLVTWVSTKITRFVLHFVSG